MDVGAVLLLAEQFDEAVVWFAEIGARIRKRLLRVSHDFDFRRALHRAAQKSGMATPWNSSATVSRRRTRWAVSPSTSTSAARGRLL